MIIARCHGRCKGLLHWSARERRQLENEIIKSGKLDEIRSLMDRGSYELVVKECSGVLEDVLKRVYQQAFKDLSLQDKKALMEKEEALSRGQGYQKMGFGALVALFKSTDLLGRWSKVTGTDVRFIRSLPLEAIADLRNDLTHRQSGNAASKPQARLAYDCMLSWLSFIGYKDMDSTVEKAFSGGKAAVQEAPAAGAPLRTYDRVKRTINSGYDSSNKAERRRLIRQAAYSEELDAKTFRYALERIGRSEGLVGLDVGCASGYVTELRFRPNLGFAKVIGLDSNQKVIDGVNEEDHGIYHYHCMDIESRDFEDNMEDLMEEEGIGKFDVIFCALTLHHLRHPTRFLSRVRRFLAKGGAIIIRGVDDGGMMAYDDNGLLDDIMEICTRQPSISDRYHGRKFYPWLKGAGFADVKMFYQIDDITDMDPDEREDFYQYYFSFRMRYARRSVENDPDNPRWKEDAEKLEDALDELKEMLLRPDFYCTSLAVSAVGIK